MLLVMYDLYILHCSSMRFWVEVVATLFLEICSIPSAAFDQLLAFRAEIGRHQYWRMSFLANKHRVRTCVGSSNRSIFGFFLYGNLYADGLDPQISASLSST